MSTKEAHRISHIQRLIDGDINNATAAGLLQVSVRQIQRLKKKAQHGDITSVLHANRGRQPANARDPVLKEMVLFLAETEYENYNFAHMRDCLQDEQGIILSRSTLARWCKNQGLASPRKQKKPKRHRCRKPRASLGELVQLDASKFDWLSNGSYLHLHGAIDDATGTILALSFAKEETLDAYTELVQQINRQYGLPAAFYTDGRTVFFYERSEQNKLSIDDQLRGKTVAVTNFTRAAGELSIHMIAATSPQAKGRIERLWNTLQDRLTKDLKRSGIVTREAAEAFLPAFMDTYNRRFSRPPEKPESSFRPAVTDEEIRLRFAKQETRKVQPGMIVSFQGKRYKVPAMVDNIRVSAKPSDPITVAHSDRIGLRMIFNGLTFTPQEIAANPVTSIPRQPRPTTTEQRQQAGRAAKAASPWRYSYLNMPIPSHYETSKTRHNR